MSPTRREFLEFLIATSALLALKPSLAFAQKSKLLKIIPSSKSEIPPIGLGTWITFNVGTNQKLKDARTEVMKEFFKLGGGLIDSSPMYGSAEAVIGYGLSKLSYPSTLFSATKVWTSSASEGVQQIKDSQKLWGVKKFDLFQVHNLEAWQEHLKTLFEMKKKGELKYVGVTTSHGRRHDELEKIMRTQPIDFVQLTYNLQEREVEKKLLPLAQERGIAVIANRPFEGGDLIKKLKGKQLPPWASEFDCDNWPQFLLKFIVSHPAITCAIPATTSVAHLQENMGAALGKMPNAALRERMIQHFQTL